MDALLAANDTEKEAESQGSSGEHFFVNEYNTGRTHHGKRCQVRTPMETFLAGMRYFAEKNLNQMQAA